MIMNNANTTRRQRVRAEKSRNAARSDYWELDFVVHGTREPRTYKRAARRAARRLDRITILESLES